MINDLYLLSFINIVLGFPGGSVVKNPPANAGDVSSTPRSGRWSGEERATHSSIFAWEIPQTEKLAGYSP